MKAVILCAGRGERLRPLTNNIPKVMIPIGGKPLLERHIEHFSKFGIKNFFINLHYLPNIIKNHFRDGGRLGVKITYSYENSLLGTGGVLTKFKEKLNERFILLYGDVFSLLNIYKLERFHIGKKSKLTIVVRETDHPRDSDLVESDVNKKVKNLFFKPHAMIPRKFFGISAIYLVEPDILGILPKKTPFDFAQDFLPQILKEGFPIFCYNTEEFIKDIGTKERYEAVLKKIKHDNFKNSSSN
ncbi:MAG: nucleotidyltransferase family protein [Candidatus Levybacteria bacterium]|nr:nucleotidyltransferase family protein [Candidatus Levybacteria bacterium]